MEKKRRFKNKKTLICIITFALLLVVIGVIISLITNYKEKQLINSINQHYYQYVITTKKAKIYNKNKKEIGSVAKDFSFILKKQSISDSSDQYFKVKGTNYYLYYEDVKPIKKKQIENIEDKINPNYLVFNKNIKTTKETVFYSNNKQIFKIKDSFNLPIQYMDDEYYYVVYLNKLLQLKKTDKDQVVDCENTSEKESDYISVLHYQKIEDNCNDINCVTINMLKEHINYLKENHYYTITVDEYKKFLEGKIRLKEKAILLTSDTKNAVLENINKESEFKLQVLDENTDLKFNNSNKKTTKESKIDSVDRYELKLNTTLDDFKKMTQGEEVAIKVLQNKSSSNEQAIPVLNYHFFYDASLGESCNERICLDVSSFRQQLDYLKNNGYRTLKMEEFKKWMYGEMELPDKSVLITIDDGAMGTGKHNGNKLIPILEEYNMNATLFLISGWWDVENYRSPNLDIQSHTNDMHQSGSCGKGQVVCATREQLLEDLKKSLSIVDNNNSFCFPFYSYSDLSLKTVEEAGFKLAFIGGNRKAKRSNNKFMIPRYPIYKTTSISNFINMVS